MTWEVNLTPFWDPVLAECTFVFDIIGLRGRKCTLTPFCLA